VFLNGEDREIDFEMLEQGSHDFLLSCFGDTPGLAVAADTGLWRGKQLELVEGGMVWIFDNLPQISLARRVA
jgi:hypothetical protein